MTTPIQFKRATRQAVKLKIGVDGPSGSGKTFGALSIATGITNGGRIAVIDSENESASFYADSFAFDTLSFPDAEAETLMAIIDAAVREHYDAVVIDSLSHVWLKILENKDAYERDNPKANRFTMWGMAQFGPRWEKLMSYLLHAPIHIVATMRSKQAYEQTDQGGTKKVVKLGLQPQVREGAEYEFGLVFSVNEAHRAECTKDRTRLFATGELVDLSASALHKRLITWMNSETPATHEACVALSELAHRKGVSDVTRKAVDDLLTTGVPSANKVERWTEQLSKHVVEMAEDGEEFPPKALSAAPTPPGEFPLGGVNPIPGEPRAQPETDLDKARAELHEAMDNPFMPKEARSYFSTRIRGGKVGTLVAARAHAALAKLCLEIGDELTAADAKTGKEVGSLLLSASTYVAETLTGILEKMKAAHPVGAA